MLYNDCAAFTIFTRQRHNKLYLPYFKLHYFNYEGVLINPYLDLLLNIVGRRDLFMCRIASLFLLQGLKGSTSGDARDFNNMETRAVIKFFFFLQGKAPKEIHTILTETGEHAPMMPP